MTAAGQVIGYTIALKNTGSTALTGVTLTDVLPDGTTAVVSGPTGDTNGDTKLQNTETWTYTVSYTVKQSDIDAGMLLVNTATGDSNETTPVSDTAVTGTAAAGPSLSIVKTASPPTYSTVGAAISYSYKVTNNGNVTITAPFTVSDNKRRRAAHRRRPASPPLRSSPAQRATRSARRTSTPAR